MKIRFNRQEGPNYFFDAGYLDSGKDLVAVPLPCPIASLSYPATIEQGENINGWISPYNLSFVACRVPPLVSQLEIIFDLAMEIVGKMGFLFVTRYEVIYQRIPEMSALPLSYYDAFGRATAGGDGRLYDLDISDMTDWSGTGGASPCYTPCGLYSKSFNAYSWYTEELAYCIDPAEPILSATPHHTTTFTFLDSTYHQRWFEPSISISALVTSPVGGVIGYDFPSNPSSGTIWADVGRPCNTDLNVYVFDDANYDPPLAIPTWLISPITGIRRDMPLEEVLKEMWSDPKSTDYGAFQPFIVSGEEFFVGGENLEVR